MIQAGELPATLQPKVKGRVSAGYLWLLGLTLVLVVDLWGLRFLFNREVMWKGIENHDTRIIVARLHQPHHPLQWFVGDWPLGNGFYRPIPALAFELDVWLCGKDLPKFKILNWLLATLCSLLLVWFVWELVRSRLVALGCGVLFAGWQSDLLFSIPWSALGWIGAGGLIVYGTVQSRHRFWRWFVLASLWFVACHELRFVADCPDLSSMSFGYRSMGWPPGRTATLMSAFALIALASYCRFERERRMGWGALALAGYLGALGSYEQAVVLPALLVGCAFVLHRSGIAVRWWLHLLPIAILGLYALFYLHFIPRESPYKLERLRGEKNAVAAFLTWLFPAWSDWQVVGWFLVEDSILILLLVVSFWRSLVRGLLYLAAYLGARQDWVLASFGLIGSVIAYTPLLFVKPLMHYYYFPAMFRSLFVMTLLGLIRQQYSRRIFEHPQSHLTKQEQGYTSSR